MRKRWVGAAAGLVLCAAIAGGAWVWQQNQPRPVKKRKSSKVVAPIVSQVEPPVIVVDSQMTRGEALANKNFPPSFLRRVQVVTVTYWGFDGKKHRGQIVVDKGLAEEVKEIFAELEAEKYPIEKVIPIARYNWRDQASVNDNNTSGFNYRRTAGPGTSGKKLSKHAYGRAIDLNPYQNPFVPASGKSPRPYDVNHPATLTRSSKAVRIFKRYGWKWGGDWRGAKDYQHFEKP